MKQSAHVVQFFEADDRLVDAVSRFTREGIESGYTCVIVATEAHRERLDAALGPAGLDAEMLSAQYRYISLDAGSMLATFMVEGQPDQERFHRNMGLLIRQAAARGQPVRIFAEMVALLAADGNNAAVVRLEELWNELSRHHNFTLFCGYPTTAFAGDARTRNLICAIHSHVLPTGA